MDCAHSINDSHTVVRHIRKNYGIGANADIIPNLYIIAKFICTDCKIQMCIFS